MPRTFNRSSKTSIACVLGGSSPACRSNAFSAFSAHCCAWKQASSGRTLRAWRAILASSRSERARRSHACTTSPGALIQHLPFLQRSAIDQSWRLTESLHLLGSGDHNIHRNHQTAQSASYPPAVLSRMMRMRKNDEQIQVTIWPGSILRVRTEQHDCVGVADLNNPPDNFWKPISRFHILNGKKSGRLPSILIVAHRATRHDP